MQNNKTGVSSMYNANINRVVSHIATIPSAQSVLHKDNASFGSDCDSMKTHMLL